MKANELRIGNWVDSNGIFYEVCSISNSSIKGIEGGTSFNLTYLEPIPLTEEWLAKFGFDDKYTSNSIYFRKKSKKKVIRLDVKNGSKKYYDFVEIKYVHQLQNLYFALTGEELMLNS